MSAGNLLPGEKGLLQIKQGVKAQRDTSQEEMSESTPAPLAGQKLQAAQRGLEEFACNLYF